MQPLDRDHFLGRLERRRLRGHLSGGSGSVVDAPPGDPLPFVQVDGDEILWLKVRGFQSAQIHQLVNLVVAKIDGPKSVHITSTRGVGTVG